MIGDGLTLDQLQVFLAVAESGSFSAAARMLGRAQSAVTYAVQRLEQQVGTELFDRTAYRPTLSEAGQALLPRARRIAEDIDLFKVQAAGLAGGLEAEVSLVIDALVQTDCFIAVLREFQATFPSVRLRLYVESLGATADMVLSGRALMGLAVDFGSESDVLRRAPVSVVSMIFVAAPAHPLARLGRTVTPEDTRDEIQLVLTDRSTLTDGRDHGVFSMQTWRLADLFAKQSLLRAGLGWGAMPKHLVAEDLAQGRLVELPVSRDFRPTDMPGLSASLIWRFDAAFGVAGQWLRERLGQPRPEGHG
jgi:DNA-binding transcriptional LysR family regulator